VKKLKVKVHSTVINDSHVANRQRGALGGFRAVVAVGEFGEFGGLWGP